jgi:hypothetical protein
MSCQKLFQRMMGIALAFLLLVGCGAQAVAPVTPSATTVTSTATPIPPKPGASFSGTINTGNKACSGSLSFVVKETGLGITSLSISLENANCNDMITMGSVSDFFSDPGIAISNGSIEGRLSAMGGMISNYRFNPGDPFPTPVPDPYTVGKIAGRFTAPTAASGTITIFLGAPYSGGVVCELGTFDWSAMAE